ncbi:MAG TPA: hypothetical protein VJP83_02400, partial [Terriglobales bacterium]|nr:hypothetical protein [Terriglobales bacterium]
SLSHPGAAGGRNSAYAFTAYPSRPARKRRHGSGSGGHRNSRRFCRSGGQRGEHDCSLVHGSGNNQRSEYGAADRLHCFARESRLQHGQYDRHFFHSEHKPEWNHKHSIQPQRFSEHDARQHHRDARSGNSNAASKLHSRKYIWHD